MNETANGGNVQAIFGEKFRASMTLNDASDTDVTLIETLNGLADSFYILVGGGTLTFTQIGFRLRDMFLVNFISDFEPNIKNNIIGIGTVIVLEFWEV